MNIKSISLPELLQHGYRYALSLTHNTSMAEDLLQDAWVAVLKADGPHIKNYLFSAIRSKYINNNKRDRLVPMVPLESNHLEEQTTNFEYEFDNEQLNISLATLRAVEREAIYLSAVEGYTAQEIADYTKQPRSTVLSLIHRARKKLRENLSEDLKEVKL